MGVAVSKPLSDFAGQPDRMAIPAGTTRLRADRPSSAQRTGCLRAARRPTRRRATNESDARHSASDYFPVAGPGSGRRADGGTRSEEHTSELQSLMRSSYAVFCLKKKINT